MSDQQNDNGSGDLQGHDAEQIRLMDEMCIVLDRNDNPIGSASKEYCHLMANIEKGLLHRAFSCFLFNSQSELLLQQRADTKITFPGLWTNTCCSHPLDFPEERGTDYESAIRGAKVAAQRKLGHELGIEKEKIPLENFKFLTRVHYKAASDSQWGEHEMDYILVIKTDVEITVNPNEIQDTRWVSAEQLQDMFKDPNLQTTPWFRLICESSLYEWWHSLKTQSLDQFVGEKEIRRM